MLIEDFKKDIDNYLKEIQDNTDKLVEAFKRALRIKNFL
jgi:Holliday junction resolvase RusA-like endonuclease